MNEEDPSYKNPRFLLNKATKVSNCASNLNIINTFISKHGTREEQSHVFRALYEERRKFIYLLLNFLFVVIVIFILLSSVLGARGDGTNGAISVNVGTCDTGIGGNLEMTVRDSSGGDPTTSTGVSIGVETGAGGMLENTGMNCL